MKCNSYGDSNYQHCKYYFTLSFTLLGDLIQLLNRHHFDRRLIVLYVFLSTVSLGSGARFLKVPKTFRARKAIGKTPIRLFCEAGLFICCRANQN